MIGRNLAFSWKLCIGILYLKGKLKEFPDVISYIRDCLLWYSVIHKL